MTTRDIAAALTRRRFLLIATAAAGSLATACAGADPLRDPDAPSGTTPTDPSPSATTAPTGVFPSSSTPMSSGGTSAPQSLRGNGSRRRPGPAADARKALSDFGADFLRGARALDPGSANLAISPYSLFTVLAMARAGAKGATAAQIDAALHSAGVQAQGAVMSAVDAGVTAAIAAAEQAAQDGDEPIVITAANQTWVQDGAEVHQEYLDALAVQFGVEAVAADFAGDPEGMRAALNAWVAQRTNDLIPDLFPKDSITPDVLVVLVNALYLKAAWLRPFSPGEPAPFTTAAGAQVDVPMMHSSSMLQGVRRADWTAVNIPYLGAAATMTILVPEAGKLDTVLASMDARAVAAASAGTSSVSLTVPAFSVHTTAPAKQIVQQLGISDIFERGTADLSGILGVPGVLFASALVHQTVVKVDEKGTEAAAATGMGMMAESAPAVDIELTVDRPFLFWISETATGAPLFLGVVTDPTARACFRRRDRAPPRHPVPRNPAPLSAGPRDPLSARRCRRRTG